MNYRISRTQRVSTILLAILIHVGLLLLLFLVEYYFPARKHHQFFARTTPAQVSFVPMQSAAPQAVIAPANPVTLSQSIVAPTQSLTTIQSPTAIVTSSATTPQTAPSTHAPTKPLPATPYTDRLLQRASPYAGIRIMQPAQPAEKRTPAETKKPKHRMTLAQLAQGFSASMQKNNPSKLPNKGKRTGEEIVMQLVGERVIEVLTRSMQKPARMAQPSFRRLPRNCVVHLILVLNKDGSVKHLQLEESTGDTAVDTYVVGRFSQCNDQFPRLPRTFKDPVAIFGFKIPLN